MKRCILNVPNNAIPINASQYMSDSVVVYFRSDENPTDRSHFSFCACRLTYVVTHRCYRLDLMKKQGVTLVRRAPAKIAGFKNVHKRQEKKIIISEK